MIELKNISKVYHNQLHALKNIDLTVHTGEIFGIIGHSGAGKSTLLRCVNLLEKPSQGSILIENQNLLTLSARELQSYRQKIGMIFQHFNLLSSLTVSENIGFPLKLNHVSTSKIKKRVSELLELTNLQNQKDQYPHQLSGGQKQRVGIARALANQPKILLCDEATSALDPQTTHSILELLKEINQTLKITIILITHEMEVISSICDRVAVIDQGEIIESGKVIDVLLRPKHQLTKEFLKQIQISIPPSFERSESLFRLTYIGKITYDPIIYEVMQQTQVSFAVLQGTISRMKDIPYGQLIVKLIGPSQNQQQAIAALKARGVEVEELSWIG